MTLRIVAFGPPRLTSDAGSVPTELSWRKHFGLLVYLARSPGATRRRDHLVGLLWPEKDDAKARHSLNEACRAIRRGAGDDALVTGADAIALAPGCLTSDWADAEAAFASGDATSLAALWRGEFLEGFGIPGATGFEDWLAAERLLWRSKFKDTLSAAAARRAAAGDAAGAFALAEKVLAADPADPAARALLERSSERSGARTRAGVRAAGDAAARAIPVPPLVGREVEMEAITGWLPRPGAAAAAVLIGGAAGHGRSRLLREAVTRARMGGALIAAAACVEADADAPGGMIAMLLRALASAPGLAAAPPDALAVLAALEPEIAHRYPGATAAPRPRDSGAAALGRALGAALAAIAEEMPVAVALDDAHLADELSLAALPSAMRAAAGAAVTLFLAAAYDGAPEPLAQLRARIGHDIPGQEVGVPPLGDAAVGALVIAMLPAWPFDEHERLVRRLRREADGVPLYLLEILRALAAGGETAGIWPLAGETTAQPLPFAVPGAVIAALTLRTAALAPDAKTALVTAAVLGEVVDEELLGAVMGLGAAAVADRLAQLERAGFLEHDGARYRFGAALVRAVLAAEMAAAGERRAIHQRAARELAARAGGGGGALLALAEQLYGAGQWNEAASTAEQAAAAADADGLARLTLRARRLAAKSAERSAKG